MKLLIIEDNDKMRNYIIHLIKDVADQIYESDNGDDAVKLYELIYPDAVLMDIDLKGIDGITAASKICTSHPEAKIIFVTNYIEKEFQERTIKVGGYAYILKENLYQLKQTLIKLKTKT